MKTKLIRSEYVFCHDVNHKVEFKTVLQRVGTTSNWAGRRECKFAWDCPYRHRCKKCFEPVKCTDSELFHW